MNIGSVEIEGKTVLAPLAGITNLPFRLMAKSSGCALVCSEMVSANGLVHGSEKTVRMLESRAEERPLSIQIFGSDPAVMARAARIVAAAGADILDINFGCAVRKIVKTRSGVALMRTPERAEAVLKAVRDAVAIPLTIKIRTGWETSGAQAFTIARIAEACGVDAVAVHPRTATQGFGGRADWALIRAVKAAVGIPVIGNGDVVAAEDALRMLDETGCDAVMIGRAAIGNPWIFSQVNALLAGGTPGCPDIEERRAVMVRFLRASVRHMGETQACMTMRSRLAWFVKGLPNASRFREAVKRVSTEAEALAHIHGYMDFLGSRENGAAAPPA